MQSPHGEYRDRGGGKPDTPQRSIPIHVLIPREIRRLAQTRLFKFIGLEGEVRRGRLFLPFGL